MSFSFSKRSMDNMDGVHPELILVFLTALDTSPIDFGIPGDGGVRTAQRQHSLFLDGKSKLDGFKKFSEHQIKPGQEHGMALDFYAYVGGRASWDKVHLAMIAGQILATGQRLYNEGKINISLTWGGTFGSTKFHGWDLPHIQARVIR